MKALLVLAWLVVSLLPPFQTEDLVPGYWEQTPLPQIGLATFYASGMMEHVLDVRSGLGQRLDCAECVGTVALLRAGDIGRKVWLQPAGGEKVGPFLVIDCARQEDVWPLVDRNWAVDVSYELGQLWGMDWPLDGVTVLADPADEGHSGLASGPLRAPTPFFVPPAKVVLSAPTPTPAVTSTPSQPTPWPTQLPMPLGPVTPVPSEQVPQMTQTPAGPPLPTPLTPAITTPTPRVTARPAVATAPVLDAGTPTPQAAVGRPGGGLLEPARTPVAPLPTARTGLTATPSPSPTSVRLPITSATSSPILPRSAEITPAPLPGDESGVIGLLRALLGIKWP